MVVKNKGKEKKPITERAEYASRNAKKLCKKRGQKTRAMGARFFFVGILRRASSLRLTLKTGIFFGVFLGFGYSSALLATGQI